MAMYPDVARKMRQEILQVCGKDEAPTFEQIKSLRYGMSSQPSSSQVANIDPAVHAVINETLRLFPPVPINVRETREHGVVLPPSDPTYPSTSAEPIYIPGGTVIMYFPMLTQRNKALWGEDAEEFKPERWLKGVPEAVTQAHVPGVYANLYVKIVVLRRITAHRLPG